MCRRHMTCNMMTISTRASHCHPILVRNGSDMFTITISRTSDRYQCRRPYVIINMELMMTHTFAQSIYGHTCWDDIRTVTTTSVSQTVRPCCYACELQNKFSPVDKHPAMHASCNISTPTVPTSRPLILDHPTQQVQPTLTPGRAMIRQTR